MLLPLDRPRDEFAAAVVAEMQRAGVRVQAPNGWEDYDARLLVSTLVAGDLVTSAYPEGYVQLRVRRRPRRARLVCAAVAAGTGAAASPILAALLAAVAAADIGRGFWRSGPLLRRLLRGAAR